jgi:hypothetical protein
VRTPVQVQRVHYTAGVRDASIPTLAEALDVVAGSAGPQIGLGIELKGPEPEAVEALALALA